ncbi:MAG: inorganic pyrophosphatase [Acidobacteria bacterium]|nr:inorganic pyrophosphatase [Acidobacteriota bacterium]
MSAKEKVESLHDLIRLLFKPHPWHGVSSGEDAPNSVNVYIEIVPTDTIKYELDKETGLLKIDRPQLYSNICPALYGFIPKTYCGDSVGEFSAQKAGRERIRGDGDPMDICVLSEKTVTHGDILLQAIPVGGIRMIDGEEADDKIIAVMKGDAAYGELREINECPQSLIDRLRHYFLTYKDVPGGKNPTVELTHLYGRDEAHEVIRRSREDYLAKFGDVEGMLVEAMRNYVKR